jgi:hypothetical protein
MAGTDHSKHVHRGVRCGSRLQPARAHGHSRGEGVHRSIWSIIGGDLFVDAGQVRDEYQQFTLDGFHVCGGAGLRFAFSERSILSVDVGFDGEPISPEGGLAAAKGMIAAFRRRRSVSGWQSGKIAPPPDAFSLGTER